MKKYVKVNISRDLYDYLKQQKKVKDTSLRIESKRLFEDFRNLKAIEKKIRKGGFFITRPNK